MINKIEWNKYLKFIAMCKKYSMLIIIKFKYYFEQIFDIFEI